MNLLYEFGKRNRLCYFIDTIKKFQKDYPPEASLILRAAEEGNLDKIQQYILDKYERIQLDYEKDKHGSNRDY